MNEENKNMPILPALSSGDRLLAAAWRIYVRRFADFIDIYLRSLWGLLPMLAVGILAAVIFIIPWRNNFSIGLLIFLAVASLLWAIYYGTRAKIALIIALKEEQLSSKEAFSKSKLLFWSYFLISLFSGLLIFLGFIFLLIPGIYLSIIWSFAVMLVVLEEKKEFADAIKRSSELVKGRWWQVMWRFLFIGIIGALVSVILNLPVSSLNETGQQVYSLFLNIIGAIISPLFLTYSYLVYKELAFGKR